MNNQDSRAINHRIIMSTIVDNLTVAEFNTLANSI